MFIRVNIGSLKTADNAKLSQYAVERAISTSAATYSSNTTTLNLEAFTAGKVEIDLVSLAHASFKEVFKGDSLGTFRVATAAETSTAGIVDNGLFSIDAKTGKLTSLAGLTTTTDATGAGHTAGQTDSEHLLGIVYQPRGSSPTLEKFVIALDIKAPVASTLSGIKVETVTNASHAVETLDKALEEVSTAQAKLGAIQNRLSHNIDNLSKGAMLTEQSVGRVVDADFATETSNLSKQQILNQAATAMLAQANQSKQSVLSLLQ